MGKNRNKNLVKSKITGLNAESALTKALKGLLNDELMVAKIIATTDNEIADIMKFFEDTTTLFLEKHEIETVCRVMSSTKEFQDPNQIVDVEKFIGHVYFVGMANSNFVAIIDQIMENQFLDGFAASHASTVVSMVCTWIMMRAVLNGILGITPRTTDAESASTEPDVVDSNKLLYVLTKEQEDAAIKLGLPVTGHTINIDSIYQSEVDLVDEWRQSNGRFAPVNEVYGMSPAEYREYRRKVAYLINEIILTNPDNDIHVASSNIGTSVNFGSTTPAVVRSVFDKYGLTEILNDPTSFSELIQKQPGVAKTMRDSIMRNNSMKKAIKSVKLANKTDSSMLKCAFGITGPVNGMDIDTVIGFSKELASATGAFDHDVLTYMIPLFSADNDFLVDFLTDVLKTDVIEKLATEGKLVVKDRLVNKVKQWIHQNIEPEVHDAPEPDVAVSTVDKTDAEEKPTEFKDPQWELVGKMFDSLYDVVQAFV